MKVTEQDLREHYESLETEQLIELHAQGTLTEMAMRVLEQVLAGRSVPTEERAALESEFKKQAAAQDATLASLASPSERLGAQMVDTVLVVIVLFLSVMLAIASPPVGLVGYLVAFAYLLLADGLPRGQSVGKRVFDIAVIDQRTRQPCTYGQSLLRNLLLSFLGIFDWIFIFGQMRQRLGDKAARTIVVRLKRREAAVSP
jgi:uncharacterized RDD family membrane protein YckC